MKVRCQNDIRKDTPAPQLRVAPGERRAGGGAAVHRRRPPHHGFYYGSVEPNLWRRGVLDEPEFRQFFPPKPEGWIRGGGGSSFLPAWGWIPCEWAQQRPWPPPPTGALPTASSFRPSAGSLSICRWFIIACLPCRCLACKIKHNHPCGRVMT